MQSCIFGTSLDLINFRSLQYLLSTNYRVLFLPKEANQAHVVHGTSFHRVLPNIAIFSKMQKHPMCSGMPAHHAELIPFPSHSHFMTKTQTKERKMYMKRSKLKKDKKLSDFWICCSNGFKASSDLYALTHVLYKDSPCSHITHA